MAAGPNYTDAKRLLGMAHYWSYGDGGDATVGSALATEALAHAVLALVDVLTEARAGQPACDAENTSACCVAAETFEHDEDCALRNAESGADR